MSKGKRSAKHRRPIRPKHRRFDPYYWENQLEQRLNEFGASSCDLSEIDTESCKSAEQYRHAVRVRARYLVRQIRAIQSAADGDNADKKFADLTDRAGLIDDGPAWFEIEKRIRRLGRSPAKVEGAAKKQHHC